MSISKTDVENLAKLARIKVDEGEAEALTKDLERILSFVDELKGADAPSHEGVSLGAVHNVMREDISAHEGGVHTEALLKNAPDREGDYVKVKNIL